MPIITIQGTPIDFPTSGTDPNWSEAVVLFAELVGQALNTSVGPFDVATQTFVLDPYNTVGISTDIPNLVFPTTDVRSTIINYSLKRSGQVPTEEHVEAGIILASYDEDGAIGSKWEVSREFVGDAKIEFAISDTGQVSFTPTAQVGTINHTGMLSFSAKSLLKV